jgi:hypothetical protein
MDVIARRFTIFTLIMTIFALSFTALIAQRDAKQTRLQSTWTLPCQEPGQQDCRATL